jgi:hypothetical protein
VRTETVTVRVGENVGPVDWDHPIAKDKPPIWREAEANPDGYIFGEYSRSILAICMYDGWPYWEPRPAVQFIGPLGSAEWAFFDSYGVNAGSIRPWPENCAVCNERPSNADHVRWRCRCEWYTRPKAQQAPTPTSAEGTEAAPLPGMQSNSSESEVA